MLGDGGFWATYSDQSGLLQHALTEMHEKSVVERMCAADDGLRTRIVSCGSRGASRWTTAFPVSPNH